MCEQHLKILFWMPGECCCHFSQYQKSTHFSQGYCWKFHHLSQKKKNISVHINLESCYLSVAVTKIFMIFNYCLNFLFRCVQSWTWWTPPCFPCFLCFNTPDSLTELPQVLEKPVNHPFIQFLFNLI